MHNEEAGSTSGKYHATFKKGPPLIGQQRMVQSSSLFTYATLNVDH